MARMETACAVLAVAVLACVLGAGADGSDHRYKEGDRVPLYANKVGPFHNPNDRSLDSGTMVIRAIIRALRRSFHDGVDCIKQLWWPVYLALRPPLQE